MHKFVENFSPLWALNVEVLIYHGNFKLSCFVFFTGWFVFLIFKTTVAKEDELKVLNFLIPPSWKKTSFLLKCPINY